MNVTIFQPIPRSKRRSPWVEPDEVYAALQESLAGCPFSAARLAKTGRYSEFKTKRYVWRALRRQRGLEFCCRYSFDEAFDRLWAVHGVKVYAAACLLADLETLETR